MDTSFNLANLANLAGNKPFEEKLQSMLQQKADRLMKIFIDEGPAALRTKLGITLDKHWAYVFDYLVGSGALYDHIYLHKDEYVRAIMSGRTKNIRDSLCPNVLKYDPLWSEILDILQQGVCTKVYPEHKFDQGIRVFTSIMNGLRGQRSLRSYKAMWAFSGNEGR